MFGLHTPVYAYGAMMALGLLVGGVGLLLSAKQVRLDVDLVLAAAGITLLFGYAGAHGLFLLVAALNGQEVLPLIGRGGIVFYGGAVAGALGGYLAAKAFQLPWRLLLDAAAVPLALGHAIGRIGCLLGGCCFGRQFSAAWAVSYRHPLAPMPDGILRHPVQAYEAIALLILSALLLARPIDQRKAGSRFAIYVASYAVLRALLETFRGDSARGLFFGSHMSTSQLLSALLFAAASTWLFRLRSTQKKSAAGELKLTGGMKQAAS